MTAKLPLVSRARFESVRTQYRALTTRLDAGMASIDLLLELAAILAATRLVPVATCRDRAEWERFRSGPAFQAIETEDEAILARRRFDETWRLPGYSFPAERFVNFHVDNLLGRRDGDRFLPNVRESLVCPVTALNNRQRLMATLIATKVAKRGGPCDIYLMEQVTSVFKWVRARFADHRTVGSEYLGPDLSPGQIVDGLRHEDIHSLSFADDSIDLIVSADVMEHVASPARAFSEVARVLRPGGVALMTFPFDAGLSESVVRAEILDGDLRHRLEPIYHVNPISKGGSLVFTDFGWDLLDVIRAQGFREVALEVYHSIPLGNLGTGILFSLVR